MRQTFSRSAIWRRCRSDPDLSRSFKRCRPKQDDLKPYLAAIDRLVSASEALRKTDAKGQSATLAQMVRFATLPSSPLILRRMLDVLTLLVLTGRPH